MTLHPDTMAFEPLTTDALPELRDRLDVPHHSPYAVSLTLGEEHAGDVTGHIENTAYLRITNALAEAHATSAGMSRERMLGNDLIWFVARHEIDYRAELWPGERVVLLTWVRSSEKVKSWRDTVMYRPSDDRVVCRVATLWVLVNLTTRRPVRITPAMVAQLAPCRVVEE